VYGIASGSWNEQCESVLNKWADLGWELKEIVVHENNRASAILQSDVHGIPETVQLHRIEAKLDELLATTTIKRRRFKFDEPEG
jgi:KaiC/GvpD/RAD55 family RecA-like ATPase